MYDRNMVVHFAQLQMSSFLGAAEVPGASPQIDLPLTPQPRGQLHPEFRLSFQLGET